MTTFTRTIITLLGCGLMLIGGSGAASAQKKQKRSLQGQVTDLQSTVHTLAEHQRDLEARIAVLERLNLAPSPAMIRESYIRSTRDAIINDISTLSSNAYQFRIRPTTMGGGGGTYVGYKIPKRLAESDYSTLEATVYPDSVVFKGVWTKGSGSVQGVVGSEGRPVRWIYDGDFE